MLKIRLGYYEEFFVGTLVEIAQDSATMLVNNERVENHP
jgi:hypothetical protein